MIEGFYGSNTLDLLIEDEQKAPENQADSAFGDPEDGEDDMLDITGNSMVPPNPFIREYALKIIKEEQERYLRGNYSRF